MKLEIGYNHHFEVRKARYGLGGTRLCSIMYLSDFHFNAFSLPITQKIIAQIQSAAPDIVLLGGDYADTRKGLLCLQVLMKTLEHHPHVYAIAGNHDVFLGKKIRKIIESYNGKWMEQSSVSFMLNGVPVCIDGNRMQLPVPASALHILCLHKPVALQQYAAQYHLVFAGHLHGCQFVFYKTERGLYPGRFFYAHNFLQKSIGACHYYISKGLGDTLPVRYNCKKDILLVDVYY